MNNTYNKCNYCGKELKEDQDIWHIDEDGEDYCYQEINYPEDIYNSCIGRELIKCGYNEEWILNLFSAELDDREINIYYTNME